MDVPVRVVVRVSSQENGRRKKEGRRGSGQTTFFLLSLGRPHALRVSAVTGMSGYTSIPR